MRQPEKAIENQILSWLKWKGIFTFKIKTMGTYDPTLKRFRTPSPWYKRGVSDILGIFKGKPLAIEVKTLKGKLSPAQVVFQQEWKEHGGISIVARSIEDLEEKLKREEETWKSS
jgi:hypothetical protein